MWVFVILAVSLVPTVDSFAGSVLSKAAHIRSLSPLRSPISMQTEQAATSATPAVSNPALSNEALQKEFRRAEFWDPGRATVFDIINVLGRWESSSEWCVRTKFAEGIDPRKAGKEQSETQERYEYASRLSLVERCALEQNLADLPFRSEAMASAVGLTVDDFNNVPLRLDAVNVVYDALAESRSSLIPGDVIDKRRRGMLGPDGGFDDGSFTAKLYKSRVLVTASWLVLGKSQIWGILILLFGFQLKSVVPEDVFKSALENSNTILAVLSVGAVMTFVGSSQDAESLRQRAVGGQSKAVPVKGDYEKKLDPLQAMKQKMDKLGNSE